MAMDLVQSQSNVSLKAMIVEDEWLLAEELRSDLENAGHLVLGMALNCKDALAILADRAIDIAFVDTQLGDETCEAVLEDCDKRGVRIVLYTAHVALTLPEFAQGREVLTKPYLQADLMRVLWTGGANTPSLLPG
jgi:DNA-binding LytR/AlgR family response regulator